MPAKLEDLNPNLAPSNLELVRKVAQDGFLEFCLAVNPEYQDYWFHQLLTAKLQSVYERVQRGEKVRLIIMVPPRHGKSLTTSTLFPAWVFGKDPKMKVIACSYSAELAEVFGQATRTLLQDPLYQRIFDTKLRADTQAKANWMTTKDGTYFGAGVGGGITGRGFKIGIIDDPVKSDQEAESELYRDNNWSWYKKTFYTRREGPAAIIVIMTRWHMDDLAGRLLAQQEDNERAGLPKEQYDQWEVIKFPAIAEEDEEFRFVGDPLCPELMSLDELRSTRNNSSVYDWSSLYQQDPILAENAEFKAEWFKTFKMEDIMDPFVPEIPQRMKIYTMVDLAISDKKGADNTSIISVGKFDDSPNIYILDENTAKMDPLQVIDYLFALKSRFGFRLVKVGIESVAYQKALQFFVIEQQRQRQSYFDVVELKALGPKSERIKGLIPYFKSGVLYMGENMIDLQRELLQFPKGKHDDRPDALSYFPRLLDNTTSGMFAKIFRPHVRRY